MTKYSIHHSVVSLFRTLIRDGNLVADSTVILTPYQVRDKLQRESS